MFSAIKQAKIASLPDDTPIACEQEEYAATAFSHSSTFGPRMKCCDSNTSATAAVTSALIVAYCFLRSSSGTFIMKLLFIPRLQHRVGGVGWIRFSIFCVPGR